MNMDELSISANLMERLKAFGWDAHRNVDPSPYIDHIAALGITPNHAAKGVLASFGGLKFNIPDGGVTALDFDVKYATKTLLPVDISSLERIAHEPVCPVARGGGYYLFATPSGKLLLLQEDWFCLFRADTLGGMLDLVFDKDHRRSEEVPLAADQKPPAYRDDEM